MLKVPPVFVAVG